jgi:hypothetical protein
MAGAPLFRSDGSRNDDGANRQHSERKSPRVLTGRAMAGCPRCNETLGRVARSVHDNQMSDWMKSRARMDALQQNTKRITMADVSSRRCLERVDGGNRSRPRRTTPSLAISHLAAALAVICTVAIAPAQAQRGPGGGHGGGGGVHAGGVGGHGGGGFRGDFHGRDFGHFSPGESRAWRGGGWRHEWHDGRLGWWWVAGGGWYFYPTPIYPYPTYVAPPIVLGPQPRMPEGVPPAQFWYFCDNPKGYYPYVASCNGPWHQVPVTQPK